MLGHIWLAQALAAGERLRPWAKRREVSPEQLAQAPLLMREPGSATRQVTERALRQAGVKVTGGMELDHIEAIKQGVMAGLGVAPNASKEAERPRGG